MAVPTVTQQSAIVRPSWGTLTADVETWPMMVRASFGACDLSLLAGRWLASITISTTGLTGEPPIYAEVDQTLASPGTVTVPAQTYRAIRPFTGTSSIVATIRVKQRSGSDWIAYGAPSTMSIALDTAPAPGTTDFGVHATSIMLPTAKDQTAVDQEIDVILDAAEADGCTTIRSSFAWSLLQPTTASTWDETQCAKVDALHDECVARGLDLVVIAGTTEAMPAWSQDVNGRATQSALNTYAGEFVARWPGVTAIEPENEPDHVSHFQTAAEYVIRHNRTWSAFKAADATLPIGLGTFASYNLTYLDELTDETLTGFDFVGLHPYVVTFSPTRWLDPSHPPGLPDDGVPNVVQGAYAVDELLRGKGYNKPIWITELGFASDSIRAPAGEGMTPKLAADRLSVVLNQVARIDEIAVCHVHWAMDYLPQSNGTWLNGFGLRMRSGGPRLAATTFHDALASF